MSAAASWALLQNPRGLVAQRGGEHRVVEHRMLSSLLGFEELALEIGDAAGLGAHHLRRGPQKLAHLVYVEPAQRHAEAEVFDYFCS